MYFCPKCSFSLDINKSDEYKINFFCNNCGYKKEISESLKLYEINKNNNIEKISSIEDNKILVQDPTLPRTKDYICKNINCISHKNTKNKEAVYYRTQNSYTINYVCTVCFFEWQI